MLAAIFVGSLPKHIHVTRNREWRVGVGNFSVWQSVRFFRRSCSHDAVNDEDDYDDYYQDDRVNGREKFRGKSPRHLARENIAGYPSWTLIKSGLRGVSSSRYGLSRWVTQGSTAPGGALGKLVGHPPGGVMAPLTTGRCFRNSPLIRLRASPLSPGAVCKLHIYHACVWLYKCRGQLYATRCHG